MPQKLPRKGVPIDEIPALEGRPKHFELIGRIAAAWAEVEFVMAYILARLANAEARSAFVLYETLSSHYAKRSAIKQLSMHAIRDNARLVRLHKLMDETKRRADERNRIVHGLWATSESLPDKVICVDAEMHMHSLLHSHISWTYGFRSPEDLFMVFEANDFTYTVNDLENTLRRIKTLTKHLREFAQGFGPQPLPPQDISALGA
jgi:hypothetical protein